MGKARIIRHVGGGLYRAEIWFDVRKIERTKVRLAEAIARAATQLEKAKDETEAEAIKLTIASLKAELSGLEKIKETTGEQDIWCADFSEDLTGDVGVIEIAGSRKNGVVIRPGYNGGAAYDPKRDGILRHPASLESLTWFYNFLIGAWWQKWKYPYRAGEIQSVNGNSASVKMDWVEDLWGRGIIRPSGVRFGGGVFEGVPITYMDCDGQVFQPGDRVIVRVEKNEPKEIIGFESNPKPCDAKILIFAVFMSDGSNGLEVGRRYVGKYKDGEIIAAYDINGFTGAPKDGFLRVFDGLSETNGVLVFCYREAGEENGQPMYEPMVIRIPIDWNEWEYAFYQSASHSGEPEFTGNNFGGYRLDVATIGWADPTSILGAIQRQEVNHDDFQVIASLWTDLNGNWIIDEGEVYPADYRKHCYRPHGITSYRDRVIVGLWEGMDEVAPYHPCDPGNQVSCKLMEFEAPYYDDPLYYWGADPSYIERHKIRDLMEFQGWPEIERIGQLQAVDGILYVVQNEPATLTAYDIDAGMVIIGSREFQGWNYLGKISVVRWRPDATGDEYRLTVMPFNSGEDRGPMYVLDWLTLEVKETINFPGVDHGTDASAVGVRAYAIGTAMRLINQYRKDRGVNVPLAYSGAMADVSLAYAQWLDQNGTVRHEDYNGRGPMERFREYNFWGVAENLALVESGSEEEIISRALATWDVSPHHKELLLDSVAIAFSFAIWPLNAKWQTVVFGPGRYMPETGEYTTSDTVWDIPPEQIGKLVICVYNVARY